jgi:hypothetical protein
VDRRTIGLLVAALAGCKDRPKEAPAVQPEAGIKLVAIDAPAAPPPDAKPAIDPKAPRLLTKSAPENNWFGVAPGYVYWCENGKVRGIPKRAGDDEIVIGACDGAFQFVGDLQGVYYCGRNGLFRGRPGSTTSTQVAAAPSCILGDLDNTDVYFIVPAFKGIEDPGLYKAARSGGDAVRILSTPTGEEMLFALDGDDIWVSRFFAGTVTKMTKAGKSPVTVITGQSHIAGVGVDAKYIYWMNQVGDEVRRRLKTGGPIETVGTHADGTLVVHKSGAYWIEGKVTSVPGPDRATAKLMRLAPGAKQAEAMVSDLAAPRFEVDDDGVYYVQDDAPGVTFIPK